MKVGFIGLGNVGKKLANSLLNHHIELTVMDLNKNVLSEFKKNGASIANSAKDLASNVDLIITCLPSPNVCSEVMESNNGVIKGIKKNTIWLEMSTTDESEVRRLGKLIIEKGSVPMEAPVSGGCHRALSGNISIFVGGSRQGFKRIFPILSIMGKDILYSGDLGSASILKVITNYLATSNLVSLGEALIVAKMSKIDLKTVFKAIKSSSGNSFVHETETQLILNGSYNINFTMDLVSKDISLFNKLAKKYNISLELLPVLLRIFNDGTKRYGSKAWSTMIVKRLEDDNKTNLRAKGFPAELTDHNQKAKGVEI